MDMKNATIALLGLSLAVVFSSCGNPGTDPTTPGGGGSDYSVQATIVQFNGAFNGDTRITVSKGSSSITGATVTVESNAVPWNASSLCYKKDAMDTWKPTKVDIGVDAHLSIVDGTEIISAAIVVPTQVISFSAGDIANHVNNTPLPVTWDGTASAYAFPPQYIFIHVSVDNPYSYTTYKVPLAQAGCSIPASLFPSIGANITLWAGAMNETTALGDNVNSATSYLRMWQNQNAYTGGVK